MDDIERLVQWSTAQGVILNGVRPQRLPGRGIGIVSTRAIEAGQDILTVPSALLRDAASTPTSLSRALATAPARALLAAGLCLDTPPLAPAWRAVLPTAPDVEASMPLCWPPVLDRLLPPAARKLRDAQRARFEADWAIVSAAANQGALPGHISRRDFLVAWCLVNSRSFYRVTPETQTALPRADHIALQPVADLFNHAAEASCTVVSPTTPVSSSSLDHQLGPTRSVFTTTRAHAAGEEVFICYGAHSNDTLLVEYGFTLDGSGGANPWDETSLDPFLCPRLATEPRARLRDAGFWAGYMLDAEGACFRTQMALRATFLGPVHWRSVLEGSRGEERDQRAADAELRSVLAACLDDADAKLDALHRVEEDGDGCRVGEYAVVCLRSRWLQIRELVGAGLARLGVDVPDA